MMGRPEITATRRAGMPVKKHKKKSLATLAKDARHGLEALLEGLHWPKDAAVFHRCIDRLLQIEEESR